MKYFGLQSQIWRNNTNSILILAMFPVVFIGLTWLFFFGMAVSGEEPVILSDVNFLFLRTVPWVLIVVAIWFIVAFFAHSSMINKATDSKPLERNENKRVYNLVENLCISRGMTMPKIRIIDDDSLNAFASGINKSSYSVSLSRGIIH